MTVYEINVYNDVKLKRFVVVKCVSFYLEWCKFLEKKYRRHVGSVSDECYGISRGGISGWHLFDPAITFESLYLGNGLRKKYYQHFGSVSTSIIKICNKNRSCLFENLLLPLQSRINIIVISLFISHNIYLKHFPVLYFSPDIYTFQNKLNTLYIAVKSDQSSAPRL